ncbi:ABC-type transport system substrate-binding protein [Bradyrhizobium algeriense]|uniref:ABC-type transport system substrate-binding protein n=1 Tax=Bradyrhizobium algeriense TaxID=634784 RepID=A0ABU8B6Q5_9BRAD
MRRDNVLTGAADIATTLPFDFYADLKSNPAVQLVVIDDSLALTIVFNTKKGPMANVAMRRAIYSALDMDPIIASFVVSLVHFIAPIGCG